MRFVSTNAVILVGFILIKSTRSPDKSARSLCLPMKHRQSEAGTSTTDRRMGLRLSLVISNMSNTIHVTRQSLRRILWMLEGQVSRPLRFLRPRTLLGRTDIPPPDNDRKNLHPSIVCNWDSLIPNQLMKEIKHPAPIKQSGRWSVRPHIGSHRVR